jgi:hypothetical protein
MKIVTNAVIFTVLMTNLAWGYIGNINNSWDSIYSDSNDPQNAPVVDENQSQIEVSPQQKEQLFSFYSNENFPSNVYADLHSQVSLVDSEITTSDLKKIFPDKCDTLIDQIATVVRSEISDVLLDGAKDIKKACPQWHSLEDGDRKDFYVALVTSMALAESSCNNKIKNRNATDGTAYGLWQSRRPLSPIQGARWTINQIENQIEKSGLLFWSNSNQNYWAVLNPNIHAHKVKRILKRIPACVIKAAVNQ